MAYKIKDIDWGKMPSTAVEFSLEDEDYFLTWYDVNGSSWDCQKSEWCVEHKSVIRRERHKVGDYHPSASNRKSTREERLAKALEGLLAIVDESDGVSGYFLYGDIAKWHEFDEVNAAKEALALYRQNAEELLEI